MLNDELIVAISDSIFKEYLKAVNRTMSAFSIHNYLHGLGFVS